MFHERPLTSAPQRRGVILMVVLALLTLFAVVGLSFVYYANAEATASQIALEAEVPPRADMDPELLASYFLGQFIYDCKDVLIERNPDGSVVYKDGPGVYSALRGHSLARTMYGSYYPRFRPTPPYDALDPDIANDVPFSGTGRLHTRSPQNPGDLFAYMNPFYRPPLNKPIDDYTLINYMFFRDDPLPLRFLRDPERLNPNPGISPTPWRTDPSQTPGPFVGGFNAPYTYPDLNNMFLAAVKADGTVLTPSFHRAWVDPDPDKYFGSLDPNNAHWTDLTKPWLKYLVLRPRPVDHLLANEVWDPVRKMPRNTVTGTYRSSFFPLPEDEGGDVKNLIGAKGGNDSIWIDLGYPVMTAPDGHKYKALFAPLIVDLDNRVNLNVHGNIRGTGPSFPPGHAVNQGWGPWSVNLSVVLKENNNVRTPAEWQNLFLGPQTPPLLYARYPRNGRLPGPDGTIPGTATLNTTPHFFARADFDEWNNLVASTRVDLNTRLAQFSCFPDFSPARGWRDGNPAIEGRNHPALYDFLQPLPTTRRFPLSNMEALLRFNDTGSPAATSELFQQCPQCFLYGNLADRTRRLATVYSFDIDRPGATPWLNQYGDYQMRSGTGVLYPEGGHVGFPSAINPGQNQDFGNDWRALLASLERLDLNRPLPSYPSPDPRTRLIADLPGFRAAETARQQLAKDIWTRLIAVTGAYNPYQQGTLTPVKRDALRWLAQLAVNIVDFIDEDDYITPFNWGALVNTTDSSVRQEWVFGTELPRLLINEAYVEFEPPDLMDRSRVSVWVELHNPFHTDNTLTENGSARLARPGDQSGGIYQLALAKRHAATSTLTDRQNTTGDLPASDLHVPQPEDFSAPSTTDPVVLPSNGGPGTGDRGSPGYYVVGPDRVRVSGQDRQPDLTSTRMTYSDRAIGSNPKRPEAPTVVLRRLACPYLRHNQPGMPQYDPNYPFNPYITIDYMEDVDIGRNTSGQDDPQFRIREENQRGNSQAASDGRREPYAGLKYFGRANDPFPLRRIQTDGDAPRNSFWRVNSGTQANEFHWLYHLDRQLVSPMELLHVSSFKPYELTQRFILRRLGEDQPGLYRHRAPWYDEDINPTNAQISHRLYRFFEFVETRSLPLGLHGFILPDPAQPGQPLPVQVVAPNRIKIDIAQSPRSFLTPSGIPVTIRAGDILVIDRGRKEGDRDLQENVRVMREDLPARPGEYVLEAPGLQKSRSAPVVTVELTTTGDRIPGKININTIWDWPSDPTDPAQRYDALDPQMYSPTFGAICFPSARDDEVSESDPTKPKPTNNYTRGDVNRIYGALMNYRTRGLTQTPPRLSPDDRPFLSLATGFYAPQDLQFNGHNVNNSLLRGDWGNNTRELLFRVPTDANERSHPYQKAQLLTRLFNNVTTRSNVFAVWMTVGFFEVIDPDARPVKLGAEIGKTENRHVRHRMFAVVDRTSLRLPSTIGQIVNPGTPTTPITLTSTQAQIPIPQYAPYVLEVPRTPPPPPPTMPWTIKAGDHVVFNYGQPNQETVLVTFVNGNQIIAPFTRAHMPGEPVSVFVVPGNPGPVARFNPRDPIFTDVVPYLSIID